MIIGKIHQCSQTVCGNAWLVKQGSFTHQDFAGHKGTIRPGDVQVINYLLSILLNLKLLDFGTINLCISKNFYNGDINFFYFLQWMTAGRGIVHSEMPAGQGVQKGLQLWINLSSKDKMYRVLVSSTDELFSEILLLLY